MKKLTQYEIHWREHIQRIDHNRLLKQILNYKPEGRRNEERPQTRWGDDFREEGKGQGALALEMMTMMMIRSSFIM